MKSIHRIGLTIASLVAVVTIAGTFVVQGYVAAKQAAAQTAATEPAAQVSPAVGQTPEIVYISPPTPAATPAPAVAAVQPPAVQPAPIIHVIVPSPGGDDGGSDD